VSDEAQRAFVRGAAVTGHVRVEIGDPGEGWLAYPEGVPELIERARRAVPDASRTVAAALLASSVAGAFAAPITGALFTEGRVPIPERVWLRPYFTGVDAVAVGKTTVTHEDPRGAALSGYRRLLVPLMDFVSGTTQRGRRALWADAGDRLATYLLLAGRARGDQDAGRREADLLLGRAEPPLRHDPAWLVFEHRGERVVWKRRPVCCLIYQAPNFRGRYCATCPLVPVAETVARTRAWLG